MVAPLIGIWTPDGTPFSQTLPAEQIDPQQRQELALKVLMRRESVSQLAQQFVSAHPGHS